MPTRSQTIADAIELFHQATYPAGLSPQTAWLGIYQVLLWYEPVNWVGYGSLPHIIDANNLRPTSRTKAKWLKPNRWQRRAEAVEAYLASQLQCPLGQVQHKADQLMKLTDYAGMQRQNSLGIAFTGLAKHVLETFGNQAIKYELELPADSIFPGITFPGRSSVPLIDVLATRNGTPIALISAKWSLRHDRINDITNECPIYKAAYNRIYRGKGLGLCYYVLTNEYAPSRLNRVLSDTCIDGLVHVHKPAVTQVCGLDQRLAGMMDLAQLIAMTSAW